MKLPKLGTISLQPLAFVRERHAVRPLNERYLAQLKDKVEKIGLKPYPLSVTPAGVLFGGNHRYEVFQALGFTEAWMHIAEPASGSLDREAIELNLASEDALPMTFVDYAEMVWRKTKGENGAAPMTQEAIGEEIGWSREKVRNFEALNAIDAAAWKIVGTTVRDGGVARSDGVVPDDGTAVPFTENLLRVLLPLWPDQQLALVSRLARGRDQRHDYDKAKFTEEAQRCRALNVLRVVGYERLAAAIPWVAPDERLADDHLSFYLDRLAEELEKRVYLDEFFEKKTKNVRGKEVTANKEVAAWAPNDYYGPLIQDEVTSFPPVKSGEPRRPSAFDRLIESCIDDYQGKMSSRVIIGDMREITAEQIADGSIDAIVTDPPYDADGVPLFEALGAMAARVLKPGGSLLVLCGETYLPEYFAQLGQYLDYRWTMAVDLPGGQAVQQFDPKIIAFWKPVLWFTKGKPQDLEWCSDMIRTDPNSNDKTKHKWGQSEQLTRGMVEKCSHVGHVVLDPFLGGGTTGVICRQLQRKFIGIEIDPDLARAALKRIGEAKPGAG